MKEDDTIFGKIIRGEIPCDTVYEDEEMLAFRDINPVAPVHILVIPKRPIINLLHTQPDDALLLGNMMVRAGQIAREQGLEERGFRLVINNGARSGQTVFHLHLHIIGDRDLSWPPG